jgi:hypothetical protein
MSDTPRIDKLLRHRLNTNGGDDSVPLRELIGQAHDEIRRLDAYAGALAEAAFEAVREWNSVRELEDFVPRIQALARALERHQMGHEKERRETEAHIGLRELRTPGITAVVVNGKTWRCHPAENPASVSDPLNIGPERLARIFHEAYEKWAPLCGYETRLETRDFDPTTPNGKLMIATCGEVIATLQTSHNENAVNRSEGSNG